MNRIFLIPAIRGKTLTQETGGHLQDTCGAGPPSWDTIMDEAMPEALTVKQSTPSRSSAINAYGLVTWSSQMSWAGQVLIAGVLTMAVALFI